MNPVLVLALLIVAGLAATRLPRVTPRQVNLRFVQLAGTPLILLGLLLGPGSSVLDDRVLRALAPVMALGIGWTGAAFGARIQWRYVRRMPPSLWLLAAAQAAVAFLAVAAGATVLAMVVPALRAAWRPLVPIALALAAIAAVSGPGAVRLAARTGGVSHAAAKFLARVATIDTAYGVLAFTVVLAIDRPRTFLPLALASGALVGVLFVGLTRLREPHDLGLPLFGAVLFGAGIGYATNLSPFIVCAVAGAVIGNYSPAPRAVGAQLQAWESPIYALLLVLAGALLGLETLWIVPAALLLAALRIAARWLAGRAGRRLAGDARLPPDVGLAGVAQGAVALALGINFLLIYRGSGAPAPGAVLTTVVVGVVLAQLAAPAFMSRALRPPELTASPAPAEVS